jgi:hypothetical protein
LIRPESQSPSPQQQQQQQPVQPWSVHRLKLVSLTLSKNTLPSGPPPSPFPRSDHSLSATASAAGELFLFGGVVHGSLSNDLYVISTGDLSATLLKTTGDVPSPRAGHVCARIGDALLIWGGATKFDDKGWFRRPYGNSIYLLNLGTLEFLISRPTLADYSFLPFSIARVDPRRGQCSRARWSFRHCCDDGRFQALRLWWSQQRDVVE